MNVPGGKAFQAMRLGSAKALRQKHAWYDQKSQVTEAGMEKAVRRVVGNEVREVACWCWSGEWGRRYTV